MPFHLLALKACVGAEEHAKGARIIARAMAINTQSKSSGDRRSNLLKLDNTTMDFHGHDAVQHTFDVIAQRGEFNVVCVGSLMKALLKNQRSADALALFQKHERFCNDVIHLLALKACTASDAFVQGMAIEALRSEGHGHGHGAHILELKTTMIGFSGTLYF